MTIDISGVVPLPALLAGGAGVVIGTATVLTGRAAGNRELPTTRWSRPLPSAVTAIVDHPRMRTTVQLLAVVALAGLALLLVAADEPVSAAVVVPAVMGAALVLGPLVQLADPIGLLDRGHARTRRATAVPGDGAPGQDDPSQTAHGEATPRQSAPSQDDPSQTAPRADVPPGTADGIAVSAGPGAAAVIHFAVICAVVVTIHDGRLLAVALLIHVVVQSGWTARQGRVRGRQTRSGTCGRQARAGDPLGALAAIAAALAPLGRDDAGSLAWRNPVVSAAHVVLPPPALWLTALLTGLAVQQIAQAAPTVLGDLARALPLVVLAVVTAASWLVLRLTIIRVYFTAALVPLAVSYGLLAAGRWLAPIDLLVFVALHATAVAVLHRQAIARHDLRAARAVQLPPRLAVLLSVLAGLAVGASG